jgi:hypothetical protein
MKKEAELPLKSQPVSARPQNTATLEVLTFKNRPTSLNNN